MVKNNAAPFGFGKLFDRLSWARNLEGSHKHTYYDVWRRSVLIFALGVLLALILSRWGGGFIGLLVLAVAYIANVFYTIVRGETYLQLRSKQKRADRLETTALHEEMKRLGHDKK